MSNELLINLPTDKQIGTVVIVFAIIVVIGLIITFIVFKIHDKRKKRNQENIEMKLKREKMMDKVVRRETEPAKTVHQIKRESRDPAIRQQQEAAVTNTLVGGISEAQKEEKRAADYYGQLGISSKKSKQIDKEKDRVILNGYLQKSNTAPIRPVYSNTLEARKQQMNELNSDKVGDEANTPALVMDSAAPSAVRYTDNTYHRNTRQKPIRLKRPSDARAAQPAEENKTYEGAIRPQTGSEVSNAVIDQVAEVQEEKPEILKSGEEAILPAAEKPVAGFVPNDELAGRAGSKA